MPNWPTEKDLKEAQELAEHNKEVVDHAQQKYQISQDVVKFIEKKLKENKE